MCWVAPEPIPFFSLIIHKVKRSCQGSSVFFCVGKQSASVPQIHLLIKWQALCRLSWKKLLLFHCHHPISAGGEKLLVSYPGELGRWSSKLHTLYDKADPGASEFLHNAQPLSSHQLRSVVCFLLARLNVLGIQLRKENRVLTVASFCCWCKRKCQDFWGKEDTGSITTGNIQNQWKLLALHVLCCVCGLW